MKNSQRFHFIGIGGISMSALAKFLFFEGFEVSGSDIIDNEQTLELKKLGIVVFKGHKGGNVGNANVVVKNGAITDDNEEIAEAKRKKLSILTRAELLGAVSNEFENVVAVAGTHGKTTTCAMIGEIFDTANKKPTLHLGGVSKNLNSNFLRGDKRFFITEACEFQNAFQHLKPTLGIILNIEPDHLDFYKNTKKLNTAFRSFASNSSHVLVSAKKTVTKKNNKTVVSLSSGDVRAANVTRHSDGAYSFECLCFAENIGRIKLAVPHLHNVQNALFAIATSKHFGISNKHIVQGLENFSGVKRRFERKGEFAGASVIIDYAHHPTEIRSAIETARDLTDTRVHVVFQPHTFSRTKNLFNSFRHELLKADLCYVFKTYSAREPYDEKGDGKTLADAVAGAKYFEDYSKLKQGLKEKVQFGDVVLILGAGDIEDFADFLIFC